MSNTQLDRLRSEAEELGTQVRAISEAATDENRDLSEDETATVAKIQTRADALKGQIGVLVTAEQRIKDASDLATDVKLNIRTGAHAGQGNSPIYGTGSEHNFIADLLRSELHKDMDSMRRLSEHQSKAVADMQRASVIGDMGGTVIPAYERAQPLVETGRPFANILTKRELKSYSWHIPTITNALTTQAVVTENTAFATSDFGTTDHTYTAKMVAGVSEISILALDFATVSEQDITDALTASYNQEVDRQLLKGYALGEVTGIFNTADVNTISGASANTFGELWAAVTEGATLIADNRNVPATHFVVSPRLWGWLASRLDSDGRPLMGYSFSAPSNVGGSVPQANFAGLNVVVDTNVSSFAHATPSDQALVIRAADVWFAEGGVHTIRVDQAKASQGTVQFVQRGYINFPGVQPTPKSATTITGLPYLTF